MSPPPPPTPPPAAESAASGEVNIASSVLSTSDRAADDDDEEEESRGEEDVDDDMPVEGYCCCRRWGGWGGGGRGGVWCGEWKLYEEEEEAAARKDAESSKDRSVEFEEWSRSIGEPDISFGGQQETGQGGGSEGFKRGTEEKRRFGLVSNTSDNKSLVLIDWVNRHRSHARPAFWPPIDAQSGRSVVWRRRTALPFLEQKVSELENVASKRLFQELIFWFEADSMP